jgi:hypothetical protein
MVLAYSPVYLSNIYVCLHALAVALDADTLGSCMVAFVFGAAADSLQADA